MNMTSIDAVQKQKAADFLALHAASPILLLANAWDATSAKIFEQEGFKAIGTTSAGISASLGYPDVQRMSLEDNLSVVQRMVRHTELPVSVDIEAGYSDTIDGVVDAARAVLAIGAVGLNLEDSTSLPEKPFYEMTEQAERIAAIREIATKAGIHLVINARADFYMLSDEPKAQRLSATIAHANAYRAAGADCIFVPDVGDLDREAIAVLVNEVDAPLNIIAGADSPPLAELEALGVARVSLGPRPMRSVLTFLREIAGELIKKGTYELMSTSTVTYAEVNGWFSDIKSN